VLGVAAAGAQPRREQFRLGEQVVEPAGEVGQPLDRFAGLLMLPCIAWVVFTTVLNIAIWRLNPTA